MDLASCFAALVDYPGPEISALVDEGVSALAPAHPEAASALREFQAEERSVGLGRLQEIYTATFDLRPDLTPNIGHHLFGEDGRRNLFMARLKGFLEERSIAVEPELPDHLSLVLRLLAAQGPGPESAVLVDECLVPAVSRMLQALEPANTYRGALQALLLWLKEPTAAAPGGLPKEV
ncbi:MAG: nitrate reductase molybdenum cofactor assembly chaperone [Terriglobia bacterium]